MESKERTFKYGDWFAVQEKAKDTVVQVFAEILKFNWLEPFRTPEQATALGSGFFINDEGYLLTNFHVVDGAISILIQIPSFGKKRFDVEIVGVYPEMDIALLKLDANSLAQVREIMPKIQYLELGDSDETYRTQEILSLGYPLGQEGLKSTQGIVSGREKIRMVSYLQITAPLNPGSSGGPSLNLHGQVIGINFAGILSAQNIGYVIPINEVKSAMNDLKKEKLVRRPYLGGIFSISNTDMAKYLGNPEDGGFYITKVFKGSSLEEAGILEGDMIYEINSYKLDTFGEISAPWSEDKISIFDLLHRYNVGDELRMVIYRKGKKKDVRVLLQRGVVLPIRYIYPQFEAIDYEAIAGLVVMELALNHVELFYEMNPAFFSFTKIENQQNPVLLITNILYDSQAHRSRALLPGDIIMEVNGIKVGSLAEFREAFKLSKKTGFLTLRTEGEIFIVLSLAQILADEQALIERYFYRPSEVLKFLV